MGGAPLLGHLSSGEFADVSGRRLDGSLKWLRRLCPGLLHFSSAYLQRLLPPKAVQLRRVTAQSPVSSLAHLSHDALHYGHGARRIPGPSLLQVAQHLPG
jgi:hypothetical protein